jgi:pantoate--beta-alanine ligase
MGKVNCQNSVVDFAQAKKPLDSYLLWDFCMTDIFTTVAAKLFRVTSPDYAYFGEKDAQQIVVIEKMARDLTMDIIIVPCSIIRETDELAISSRNAYLVPN